MPGKLFYVLLLICILITGRGEAAKKPEITSSGLMKMSIEELMEVKIFSVSKKEEKLFQSPAAIYVITGEDIRRSGARSIPEALRLAPGLQVARIDANKWAISSRGFNRRFANKLLVLMDGRSVYTPFFAGVYWDVQDTMLEDVDRIEVIRGPGATLWGANAVNGVINIITKNAGDTRGGIVTGGSGNEETGFGGLRYGGKLGKSAFYSVYAKYFKRDNFVDGMGKEGGDEWDVLRSGFRIDHNLSGNNSLTLQGDVYNGDKDLKATTTSLTPPFSSIIEDDVDISGGNLLGRWKHIFSDRSDMALQSYYDRTERKSANFKEIRDIFDLDFQHRFLLGERNEFILGLGYRFITDNTNGSFSFSLDPANRDDHLFSSFVQDEITLIKNRLRMIMGSKFEYNDYVGFEIQPNGRLLWTPSPQHTVWGAISRAVRTPSRADHDMRINTSVFPGSGGPSNVLSLFGSRDFDSENLIAYELGYRLQPIDRFFVDIATFYNKYENLRTFEPDTPFSETTPSPSHLVIPLRVDNKLEGETYGVEIAGTWDVTEYWRLMAWYTWLDIQLHLYSSSGDTTAEVDEGESPDYQFHFRSYLQLPWNLEMDTALYYVDSLPAQDVSNYLRFDARLGWRPAKSLEISFAVQNLFDDVHPEFITNEGGAIATEIGRNFFGTITLRF